MAPESTDRLVAPCSWGGLFWKPPTARCLRGAGSHVLRTSSGAAPRPPQRVEGGWTRCLCETLPGRLEKERGCWGPRAHTHRPFCKCESVPKPLGPCQRARGAVGGAGPARRGPGAPCKRGACAQGRSPGVGRPGPAPRPASPRLSPSGQDPRFQRSHGQRLRGLLGVKWNSGPHAAHIRGTAWGLGSRSLPPVWGGGAGLGCRGPSGRGRSLRSQRSLAAPLLRDGALPRSLGPQQACQQRTKGESS